MAAAKLASMPRSSLIHRPSSANHAADAQNSRFVEFVVWPWDLQMKGGALVSAHEDVPNLAGAMGRE